MTPNKVVKKALEMAKQKENDCPSLPVIKSIIEQLKFLQNFLDGKDKDRTKLMKLMFGFYAARELEETDPEFSHILHKAFYVASQKQKGLKIDENVLNE